MKTLFQTALELQNFFEKNKWLFCFIGGIALQRWGQPRLTVDIDVTLLTGFGNEKSFIDALLSKYTPRINDAAQFATENRVLLVKSTDNISIDIALAGLAFEEKIINRSTKFEFLPGINIRTCSAEDLIVLKSFADRPRDWADIESIIDYQKEKLDKQYIFSSLKPLCELKETPEILQRLTNLFKN